jgi:hypothetical protein
VGRRTELVSTVLIVGVGLKVTLRPAFDRGSTFEGEGGRRGVLSVAVVEAIDAIATNRKLKGLIPRQPWDRRCAGRRSLNWKKIGGSKLGRIGKIHA